MRARKGECMAGTARQEKGAHIRAKSGRAFAVSSLLAEPVVLSCKGNAVNKVYFRDPGEMRSPRGSVL